MLVVGCGNSSRGDDGVGLYVAGRLRRAGLRAIGYTGDSLGLMDLWGTSDDVFVVDAVLTGAPAGGVHLWDGRVPLPKQLHPASSHGFDVTQALELARVMGRLPASLQVCGIEACDMEIGATMSAPVRRAASALVRWFLLKPARSVRRQATQTAVRS